LDNFIRVYEHLHISKDRLMIENTQLNIEFQALRIGTYYIFDSPDLYCKLHLDRKIQGGQRR